MKRVIGLIFCLLISVMLVNAQDNPPQSGERGERGERRGDGQGRGAPPSFADMDKNKDGKVSREEFPGPVQFFERIDEDRDGFINEAEMKKARERFANGGGARVSELLMRFLDSNKDTKLTRDEFTKLLQLFDALDKDHDGQVSGEELAQLFQRMNDLQNQKTGGVEVANLFEKFDKNKDGKLTAEEMNNERTFKALDLNKDGNITTEEAEQALKLLAERSKQKS